MAAEEQGNAEVLSDATFKENFLMRSSPSGLHHCQNPETVVTALAGTESTLGGPGMSKGGEPAVSKADTTAGSSTTQKIEKPQEVISFEAAKEVCCEVLC